MEDLSGRYAGRLNLVPSSMSGGNTLSETHALSMSAPGSQSINPVPDRLDVLPLPRPTGPQIPVSNGRNKPRPAGGGQSAPAWKTGSGG